MPPKTRHQAQNQAGAHTVVQAPPAPSPAPEDDEDDEPLLPLKKVSDFTSRDETQSGVLTTIIEIKEIPRYGGWISKLEVTFNLELKDGEEVEAGYLIAFVMNKTIRNDARRNQFVEELLIRDTLGADPETGDADPTAELRAICRMLYTKQGTVRHTIRDHENAASAERLVVIDTWKLEDRYRGTGLSALTLNSFHDLVRQFLEVRTVVLQPARAEGSNWGKLTDVEVERTLIQVYGRHEYNVWIQGDEDVEGSMTIMGRTFEEWHE